jgi:hypothetical protein
VSISDLKGVDGVRARRVQDIFKAFEREQGPVNGSPEVQARKLVSATLTLAFFTAELREEAQEIHKAIYDGNPQ